MPHQASTCGIALRAFAALVVIVWIAGSATAQGTEPAAKPQEAEADNGPVTGPANDVLPAATAEAQEESSKLTWLPFAIFGAVATPVFLVLLVLFSRKNSSVTDFQDRPRRPARTPRPESRERPASHPEEPGLRADELRDIPEVLPDEPVPVESSAKQIGEPKLTLDEKEESLVPVEVMHAEEELVPVQLAPPEEKAPRPAPAWELVSGGRGTMLECPECGHCVSPGPTIPPWCGGCGISLKRPAGERDVGRYYR